MAGQGDLEKRARQLDKLAATGRASPDDLRTVFHHLERMAPPHIVWPYVSPLARAALRAKFDPKARVIVLREITTSKDSDTGSASPNMSAAPLLAEEIAKEASQAVADPRLATLFYAGVRPMSASGLTTGMNRRSSPAGRAETALRCVAATEASLYVAKHDGDWDSFGNSDIAPQMNAVARSLRGSLAFKPAEPATTMEIRQHPQEEDIAVVRLSRFALAAVQPRVPVTERQARHAVDRTVALGVVDYFLMDINSAEVVAGERSRPSAGYAAPDESLALVIDLALAEQDEALMVPVAGVLKITQTVKGPIVNKLRESH